MDGAVNEYFGLSYARWLVVPRVIMQAMPLKWQKEMVALLNEMNNTYDWDSGNVNYEVMARGDDGKLTTLPPDLCEYRRPNGMFLKRIKQKPTNGLCPICYWDYKTDEERNNLIRYGTKWTRVTNGIRVQLHAEIWECPRCRREFQVDVIDSLVNENQPE